MPRRGSSPFDVVAYSPDALVDCIVDHSMATAHTVRDKLHTTYLTEYFQHLGVKTIIVERNYVDRDFLDDFAHYYVKCFTDYERWCTRLHFFDKTYSKRQIDSLIASPPSTRLAKRFQDSYIGFIVIKNLPYTVIGRTCLRVYSDVDERRFPITRTYESNLFGQKLTVETLAFQEQDNETSACATSALWSVFHGTGRLFHHPIPSPVEITTVATKHQPLQSRSFPNRDGLTGFSMAEAIRSVGLEPLAVSARDLYVVLATVYAYLSLGIPLVLGFWLVEVDAAGWSVKVIGKHAVAITGFRIGQAPMPVGPFGFLSMATRLTKLYAHDDQVGPFARMEIDGGLVHMRNPEPGQPKGTNWSLSTSWRPSRGGVAVRAIPDLLLVPLYSKMRMELGNVLDVVNQLDQVTKKTIAASGGTPSTPVWDIRLETVSRYKADIRSCSTTRARVRRDVALKAMPRFLWVASAAGPNGPSFDVLFDATDLRQGDSVVEIVERAPGAAAEHVNVAKGLLQAGTVHVGDPFGNVLEHLARLR